MATKRRTDYRVDEDALKRMMAGDVTALEETAAPAETPEIKPFPGRDRRRKPLPIPQNSKQENFRMRHQVPMNTGCVFWKQS